MPVPKPFKRSSRNGFHCPVEGCGFIHKERKVFKHVGDAHPRSRWCDICCKDVSTQGWQLHLGDSAKHRMCHLCPLRFKRQGEYEEHCSVPHGNLWCNHCHQWFLTPDMLAIHVFKLRQTNPVGSEGCRYKHHYCPVVGCSYSTENTGRKMMARLSAHYIQKHSNLPGQKPAVNSLVVCLCDYCGRAVSRQGLADHVLSQHVRRSELKHFIPVQRDESVQSDRRAQEISGRPPSVPNLSEDESSYDNESAQALSESVPSYQLHAESDSDSEAELETALEHLNIQANPASVRREDIEPGTRSASATAETASTSSLSPSLPSRCRLCLNDSINPVNTLCGHVFCYRCIVPDSDLGSDLYARCRICALPIFIRRRRESTVTI